MSPSISAVKGDSLSDNKNNALGPGAMPGDTELAVPAWRLPTFFVSHAIAGLLVVSWCVASTREWWDVLDERAFRLLNGTLVDAPGAQFFWAAANHRSVDLFSGTLAAMIFIWWLWGHPRAVQNWRCAVFAAVAIPVVILPFIMHEILEQVFHFERYSPTMVYEDAQRLTKLVPELVTKDASRYSFPGDHAFVLFSVILFYGYFHARRFVLISAFMAVVFSLPRLVAGAHWMTDNIIGGVVPALMLLAWVLATPAGYYLARLLLPMVRFFVSLLPAWLRIPEGRQDY